MSSKTALSLVLLWLAVLLTGCANQNRLIVLESAQIPNRVNLQQVPFFPQQPLHCGPAALATVLVHYQQDVTPESLAPFLFTPGAKGTYALDMAASIRREGLLALPAPQSLAELLELTAQGYPSIHLMNLGFRHLPKWHYAVLVGYDIERNAVLMRSGRHKMRWYSFYHFERSRALADYWSVVPVPVDRVPRLASWESAYAELLNFQEVRPELAQTAWETASDTYRDYWQFPFAEGNVAWGKQDFQHAVMAYKEGLVRAPLNASLWNNLGYAYQSQLCNVQAIAAVQCSVLIAPDNAAWQSSLLEFSAAMPTTNQCLPVLSCPLD